MNSKDVLVRVDLIEIWLLQVTFKLFIDGGLERGRPTPLKLFFTKCYNYIAFLFLTIGTNFAFFFFFLVDKKGE